MKRPFGLAAADTGSVAMKNAHSSAAPLNMWNPGLGSVPGLISHMMPAGTSSPAPTPSGMCQRMTLRIISHKPPIAMKLPIHSQPTPPKSPMIGNDRISAGVRMSLRPDFIASRGVARLIWS